MIEWRSKSEISVLPRNLSLMARESALFAVPLTILPPKSLKANRVTHTRSMFGLSVSSFIPWSSVSHLLKLLMSRRLIRESEWTLILSPKTYLSLMQQGTSSQKSWIMILRKDRPLMRSLPTNSSITEARSPASFQPLLSLALPHLCTCANSCHPTRKMVPATFKAL